MNLRVKTKQSHRTELRMTRLLRPCGPRKDGEKSEAHYESASENNDKIASALRASQRRRSRRHIMNLRVKTMTRLLRPCGPRKDGEVGGAL